MSTYCAPSTSMRFTHTVARPPPRHQNLAALMWRHRAQVILLPPIATPSHAIHPARRDEGIFRFVRYVSAAAPSSRWDVSCEYEICVPDDGDEDAAEEEEGEEEADQE